MSSHVHNTNAACCTIPPVSSSYTPKGSFKPLAGFDRVYVTGSGSGSTALVCVYDIFGYFPQTQQGADILASALDTTVYMPDFFGGKPFPNEKFPPQTDAEKQQLQDFFGGIANPPTNIERLVKVGKELKNEGKSKVGAYGFCWGGKMSVNAGGEGSPFSGVAIVHPAMLSADDAAKLTVPLGIFISKDEDVSEYNKVLKAIESKPFAKKNDSKNYDTMHHGWAAARADLDNADNKKQYEDVYQRLTHFFKTAWE